MRGRAFPRFARSRRGSPVWHTSRADGRFLVYGALAEQPDEEWWVAVRDTKRGTDYQIAAAARRQSELPGGPSRGMRDGATKCGLY